jgi:hypothetical protein
MEKKLLMPVDHLRDLRLYFLHLTLSKIGNGFKWLKAKQWQDGGGDFYKDVRG